MTPNSTNTRASATVACSFTGPVAVVDGCAGSSMTRAFVPSLPAVAASWTNAATATFSFSSPSGPSSARTPIAGRLSSTSSSSSFVGRRRRLSWTGRPNFLSRPSPSQILPPFHVSNTLSSSSPTSSSSSPSSDNSSNNNDSDIADNEEAQSLLTDLRDDGSPRQILALLRVSQPDNKGAANQSHPQLQPSLSSATRLALFHRSGVMQSKYRKTRISAMDTLGKLLRTHPSEAPVLTNVLLTDTDHSIRAAAAGGLGNLSLPASAPSMQAATDALRAAAISDEHFIVRYSAIVALGNVGDVTSIGLLVPLVDSTLVPALEAVAAIDALGEIVKETPSLLGDMNAAKKAVLGRSTDKEDLVRAAVARALFEWKQAVSHGAETAESDDNVRFTGALNDMLKNEEQNGQSTFVLGLLQKLLECDSNSD